MKINDSDLFFTCSLIELIGRSTKQKRSAVVALLGEKILSHIYSNAGVLHCEPIAKNADAFIEMCNIPEGSFDNVADCKYEVPDYWTIGKVFARLIEDVASGNAIETLQEVYLSPVCDAISNYNSDFFYQPRGFIKEFYLDECKNSPKKRKTPALRFAGFTDAWEQRKVREVTEDYVEKTVIQNQYPVLTSSQQQGIVLQEKYFADRQVTTSENIGYFVLPRGFFTYRSRSDTDVFVFNRNMLIDKGIISKYYPVFSAKDTVPEFLLRRLNFGIRKQLSMAAEGTGQKVLAHSKFKDMVIVIPEPREQEKIGAFFESLDRLITLHQRKYDKLTKVKKSMLEKMFPKNGSDVPEIRFSGFTDAWEQRKVNEIADIVGGGTPSTHNPSYWDGDINWYAPAEMEGKRYAVTSERKITQAGLSNSYAKILPAGRTILFTSRAGIGKVAILQHDAATNQGFQSLVLKDGISPYFIYSMGSILKKKAEGIASGSTFLEISGKMLGNIDITIPISSEQHIIADFFRNLDDLITLHQRELDRLQKIKKSCLEKMFV